MARKVLYKFLDAGIKSHYDGSPWAIGEWRSVAAPNTECIGLNASELVQGAMNYVQGAILAKVEVKGKIIKTGDKWTCEHMRIIAVAAWSIRDSIALAIYAAESVLSIYENQYPEDKRPRAAIVAARACLQTPTSDAAARAADAAAGAADAAARASDAAAGAAYAAAWAASDAAAWAASDAAARAASDTARAAARMRIHRHALSLITWRTAL